MADQSAKQLFQQAVLAAKQKDLVAARQLIQASIRKDPTNDTAWLVFASIAETKRDKLICLKKVLELNPNNTQAIKMVKQMGIDPSQLTGNVPQTQKPAAEPENLQSSKPPPTSTPAFVEDELEPEPEPEPETEPEPEPEPEIIEPPKPEPRPADPNLRLQLAAEEAEEIAAEFLIPPRPPGGITWVKKEKGRAGENEIFMVRMAAFSIVSTFTLIVLISLGSILWSNEQLREQIILFIDADAAATATYQQLIFERFGPTATPFNYVAPTASPGFTATMTPPPVEIAQNIATPSMTPSVPPSIGQGDLNQIEPTQIYLPGVAGQSRDLLRMIDRGDYAPAISTAQAEINAIGEQSFDTNVANLYYSEALAKIRDGDVEEALTVLQGAEQSRIALNPSDELSEAVIKNAIATANLALGREAIANGTDASAYFAEVDVNAQRANEIDIVWAEPYLIQIERHLLTQNYSQALSIIENARAVPDLENDVRFLVAKGEIQLIQGDLLNAEYQAFLALYIDPSNAAAHDLNTLVALELDNSDLASIYAQNYAFYHPLSTRAWELLARARIKEGKEQLAFEAYRRAIELGEYSDQPAPREANLAFADRYEKRRQYALALQYIEAVVAETNDNDLRERQLILNLKLEDYASAEELANQLQNDAAISDGFANYVKAIVIANQPTVTTENYAEIADLIDQGIGQIPADFLNDANILRARAYFNKPLGEGEDAMEIAVNTALNFVNTVLNTTENIEARLLRGELYEAVGRYEEAIKEYEQVLTLGQLTVISDTLRNTAIEGITQSKREIQRIEMTS